MTNQLAELNSTFFRVYSFFTFFFYYIEPNLTEDFPENALSQIKTRWRAENTFNQNPLRKYQLTEKDSEPLMKSLRTRLKSKEDLKSIFL